MGKIVIDPITRIEGHLAIEAVVEEGIVKEARSSGTLFRGLELILQGRDPRDAPLITQRICGVCPIAHAMASTFALDRAFGLSDKITKNGRIIRNLILGSNFIQSHVLHFYHLAALDYVDLTAAGDYDGRDPALRRVRRFLERGELGPFLPRYEGDYRLTKEENRAAVAHYLEAFEVRRKAHELLAIFGGKAPHTVGIVPGGAIQVPTVDKIASFLWRLNEIRSFIDNIYIPDVLRLARRYPDYLEIGSGCKNLLAYGGFPQEDGALIWGGTTSGDLNPGRLEPSKITESVRYSWYASSRDPCHPEEGETKPHRKKEGAYSWLKAPRYNGKVYEVGPLARLLVNYAEGNPRVKVLVDQALGELRVEPQALFSVLGRHLARALDCKLVADAMAEWVMELDPGGSVYTEYELPDSAQGFGLVEAPRGALGHWLRIEEGKIAHYQCVVPTTWNVSPRDKDGRPGPLEQALEGTKVRDERNPFEIVRIVRSFDPCLACAVHLVRPKGRPRGKGDRLPRGGLR
ncbi:TPA: nickel-dependent hydrogenase large subunit [Candidatus Bipolaricaulota bacterium]|nr:nickel-dependent hydrogenase large subunit [Candidatus Bipolaricaulota bacterium]